MEKSSRSASPCSTSSRNPATTPLSSDSGAESGYKSKTPSRLENASPNASSDSEAPFEEFNVPPEPRDAPLFVSFLDSV